MKCNVALLIAAGVFFAGVPARAATLVRLQNGTEIEARSVRFEDGRARLTVGQGMIEVPAAEIAATEFIPDDPPPQPKLVTSPSAVELLTRASLAQGLPSAFVQTVALAESNLDANALSNKGAVGLMQLMPATASDLGVRETNPAENALGGAKYLRELLLRYHGDSRLALAAYNAGPAAVDRYHGVPPYPETVAYVNRVLRNYEKLLKAAPAKQTPSRSAR